ncbi:MAG: gliding motility-associated C-terminal domain-containing protein [Bacteroidia bacterium]
MAIESFRMSIYNRWGEKLFESADIAIGWDGNYRNVSAPVGVYIYLIEYSYIEKGHLERKIKKGTVQLVR